METSWKLGKIGQGMRRASADEIAALRALEGAPHVTFGCMGCGMVNWSAKNLALSSGGQYNGARNIFVMDWKAGECECPAHMLRCVVNETAAQQELDETAARKIFWIDLREPAKK